MSADDYTQPERSAEVHKARRALKRYKAHRAKHGPCSVCRHRDRTATFWGRSICRVGDNRQHPTCEQDGKGARFEFDETVLEQFKDQPQGT